MSYDVTIYYGDSDHELFWRNHTSTTSRLWCEAGVDLNDFHAKPASELIVPLSLALSVMHQDEKKFRSMTDHSEWGNYDTTVAFLEAILRACVLFPGERLAVSA